MYANGVSHMVVNNDGTTNMVDLSLLLAAAVRTNAEGQVQMQVATALGLEEKDAADYMGSAWPEAIYPGSGSCSAERIRDTTGGVVLGDDLFMQRNKSSPRQVLHG